MNYYTAVQCENSKGETGCFIRDDARFEHSPTFAGLVELYTWMRANGWENIPNGVWTCRRVAVVPRAQS